MRGRNPAALEDKSRARFRRCPGPPPAPLGCPLPRCWRPSPRRRGRRRQAPRPPRPASAAKAPPPAQKRAPAKAGEAGAAPLPAGAAGLRERVEQLEEQLVDMVVDGTLESLAKSGGGRLPWRRRRGRSRAPTVRAMPPGSTAWRPRSARSRASSSSSLTRCARDGRHAAQGRGRPGAAERPRRGPRARRPWGRAQRWPLAGLALRFDDGDDRRWRSHRRPAFGSARLAGGRGGRGRPGARHRAEPVRRGGAAAAGRRRRGGNPKQLYETAYAQLLQQDYASAEAAFDDFLKRFPAMRSPATRSTGSGNRTSCAGSTRRRRAPSSRATRATARAPRRPTAS